MDASGTVRGEQDRQSALAGYPCVAPSSAATRIKSGCVFRFAVSRFTSYIGPEKGLFLESREPKKF